MRRRSSLSSRITVGFVAVAVLAGTVSGLLAARLVSRTAQDVSRSALADQADVVASQLQDAGLGGRLGLAKVAQVLRGQDISVVLVRPNGLLGRDAVALRAAREAGVSSVAPGADSVSRTVSVAGATMLVEARAAGGGGFALVQRAQLGIGAGRQFVRNLTVALVVGALVAVVSGLLLSRLLARPLRRSAGAARTLREGRRDVRVPVEGPSEVAEVAAAVNDLADALARSEARQRDFLLSVSHELRTPLTAVRGYAESLADGVVAGADVPRVGRTVQGEARRLERLVEDLMELARLEADDFRLEPVEVDLGEVMREAEGVWRDRSAAAGVRFGAELPTHPVRTRTDPRRLRQVIDGLTENALRVTPKGAPLVLALRAGESVVTLQVRDGGPGLAEEDYPHVFERGALHERYRSRRPVGSGGIGLSLVHALVRRMGGHITASRAPEGGACFTVELPR